MSTPYVQIIYVGKLSENFQAIARHYQKMILRPIKLLEISYSQKLPSQQIKQFEAKLISKYFLPKSYKVALDVRGHSFSSDEFAKLLNDNLLYSKIIEFIIGGAFGLDESILDQVNIKLSLSKMTMPHQMAQIILLEQIYRAQTILANHPYHK
jgi:23S rRNA (pseudouridine1915-N3)-methyltransferase